MRFVALLLLVVACKAETDESKVYETHRAALREGQVVSRKLAAPGESDLVLLTADGERSIAPAPGPDDMPVALPNGQVAFVSARTTIASIWKVDPETGHTVQLTNAGLVAGEERTGFVPTPIHGMRVEGRYLVYAGAGGTWRVDYETGEATVR